MSKRAKLIPVVVACGVAGTLSADESEAPDLSFLEYLGSWEEGDEEWLVVAEMVGRDRDTGVDAGIETRDGKTQTETETMADTETELVDKIDDEDEDTEAGDESHETHAE